MHLKFCQTPRTTLKRKELNLKTMAAASTDLYADTPHSSEISNGSLGIIQDTEKGERDPTVQDSHEYPSGIARALIIGPVTLTYFLFFLDLAVLSTATPAITSDFNSLVDVGW